MCPTTEGPHVIKIKNKNTKEADKVHLPTLPYDSHGFSCRKKGNSTDALLICANNASAASADDNSNTRMIKETSELRSKQVTCNEVRNE